MSKVIGDEPLESLLAELNAESDNGGMTIAEISARTGRSGSWVRLRLRDFMEQDRLIVGRRRGVSLDGKGIQTPVYRLKSK